MLINLRNALMAGKRLPYDNEVEYLESTGTQWIDTGVLANGEFDFDYVFRLNTLQGNTVGMGARSASQFLTALQINDASQIAFAYLSTVWPKVRIDLNIDYRVQLHFHSGSQSATVNDAVLFTDTKVGTESLNLPIYIFKRSNSATETTYGLNGRFYSCKIWQNGVLVRDFIPVRKGTVGYLYDRVSGKLFGNAGTGDFVLGPDVVPVEYIESHGTEYIGTGFKASNSTRVAVDFDLTSSTANRWILGARNGTVSATDKFALFYGNSSYAMIGSAMGEFSGATIKTGRHLLDMSLAGGVVVDSQIVATYSASEQAEIFSATYAMVLFNLWNGSLNSPFIGKYYACDFWDNGDPVRKFRPVRVGTDATSWEGAMMDVLTRRIYRNDGTGAFTYGNDLKYPIPAA